MPTFEEFRLPDAGEGLTEAEIVSWSVAVGDTVTLNQALVEIETAKSIVELPSPFAGVVTELLVEPGITVEVGTPIIVIDTDPAGRLTAPATATEQPAEGHGTAVLVGYGVGEHASARRARRGAPTSGAPAAAPTDAPPAGPSAAGPSAAVPPTTTAAVPAPAPRTATIAARSDGPAGSASVNGSAERAAGRSASGATHALAKPPVRKIARDLGVDLDAMVGTGPGGIV
ncbi:MAG TPA: biotin/lipoyl-containing protein, partial [Cellulomonadaceae bacterium]|nr:biotin/lipoyl-containing protein [Cellulomonadaceae bacterium]